MIEVSDLHKSFDQNHVLKGVNLKISDGKSMVIIGASGQGKSVILKCLLGLIKPDKGLVLLNGIDPNSKEKNIALAKIGMLFQGGALFDSLPVWQNVAFRYLNGKRKINTSEARKIAIDKLNRVGLKDSFADNFPSELSGGMQKRVAKPQISPITPPPQDMRTDFFVNFFFIRKSIILNNCLIFLFFLLPWKLIIFISLNEILKS